MASDKWLQPPLTMTEELPTQSATASVYRQRGRGEGSTEERDRESSLEGGVKVLDNCSTKCCCWALWLQSGEATRTYLCWKWMHSTDISPPGIFTIAHSSIIWSQRKSYAFITSLHPCGATNALQQFALWEWQTTVCESCTGLSEFSSNVFSGMKQSNYGPPLLQVH